MNISGDYLASSHHLIYQPPSSSASRSRSASRHNIYEAQTTKPAPPIVLVDDRPTIVALIDIDEPVTAETIAKSSSLQQQNRHRKSRSKLSIEDEASNLATYLTTSNRRPSHQSQQLPPPKQRKSRPSATQLNIPKTLIVTDSNAVVIDNIDLQAVEPAAETFNSSNNPRTSVEMPGLQVLNSSNILDLMASNKKRSDSKASSIRDNNSVIFPSNIDMMHPSMDVTKLNNTKCCCCFVLLKKIFSCSQRRQQHNNHQQNNIGNHQSNQQIQSPNKKQQPVVNNLFIMFIIELKRYLVGISASFLVCLSIVLMNYLIRRTFNFKKLRRLNSTMPNNGASGIDILAIETTATKFKIDCEFCYSLVWFATSCLLLVYPVYIVMWLLVKKIRRPKKSLPRLVKLFSSSLNVFKNPPQNNYKKIPWDSTKSERNHGSGDGAGGSAGGGGGGGNGNGNGSGRFRLRPAQPYHKRNYYIKIGAITLLWLASGYFYLRAIDLLYCIDVIILFSINYSFIYMIKWIILHHKFIPLRVRLTTIND